MTQTNEQATLQDVVISQAQLIKSLYQTMQNQNKLLELVMKGMSKVDVEYQAHLLHLAKLQRLLKPEEVSNVQPVLQPGDGSAE